MRTHPKTWTLGIAGITLIVALVLFLGPQSSRDLAAVTPDKPVPATAQKEAPVYGLVAPADVLGTGTPWAPLTGDGSN
jgi:hypothetical protein